MYSVWGWLCPWGTSPPLWRRTDPGGRCSGSSTPTSRWTGRRPTRTGGEEFWPVAEELRARAATGEEVRIWADDTPDGACGLRHAAALLAGLDARVTLVSLPRWWERPDGAVVRWERGWGEVHPEEFGLHLGGAEELTRPVLRMLALEWSG